MQPDNTWIHIAPGVRVRADAWAESERKLEKRRWQRVQAAQVFLTRRLGRTPSHAEIREHLEAIR